MAGVICVRHLVAAMLSVWSAECVNTYLPTSISLSQYDSWSKSDDRYRADHTMLLTLPVTARLYFNRVECASNVIRFATSFIISRWHSNDNCHRRPVSHSPCERCRNIVSSVCEQNSKNIVKHGGSVTPMTPKIYRRSRFHALCTRFDFIALSCDNRWWYANNNNNNNNISGPSWPTCFVVQEKRSQGSAPRMAKWSYPPGTDQSRYACGQRTPRPEQNW